jgi:hypothetical protein
MAISRYANNWPLNGIFGSFYESFDDYSFIYDMIENNKIKTHEVIVRPGDRLDHIAFKEFGDGEYFWILALCNKIGFIPQVPPGTILQVPDNIDDVLLYFKE